MRGASFVLGMFVVAVASAAACADGDSPGFENVGGAAGDGGGGGSDGDGGDGTGTTSGQATGPSSVTATTSVTSGATTGSTGSSTSTSTASTGAGGAPPCQDTGVGEPQNDAMTTAYFLGTIGDDDDDGGSIMGILHTPVDVDWYVFQGEDNFGSVVDPTRSIVGAGIRLCKYLDCNDENAEELECPSGTQADTQGGHDGCCWTAGGEVAIGGFGCADTTSDDAKVYLRVDHVGGPGCEAYTVNYHY